MRIRLKQRNIAREIVEEVKKQKASNSEDVKKIAEDIMEKYTLNRMKKAIVMEYLSDMMEGGPASPSDR